MTRERIIVPQHALKRLWQNDDAVGMIHDHRTGHKVVIMRDGTEYATPFTELGRADDPTGGQR